MDTELVKELLESTLVGSPRHQPGTRPVHSFGIGVHGHFRGSTHAQRYCAAEIFSPEPTPTVVRFSNSAGQDNPEAEPQIRGMAVKFFQHAPLDFLADDGPYHRHESIPSFGPPKPPIEEADLICTGLSNFFAAKPEPLIDLFNALGPQKVKPPNRWEQLLAKLKLNPLPEPAVPVGASADAAVLKWANGHRESHAAVAALGLNANQPPPASFGRLSYHAVHAFNIVGVDGNDRPQHVARFSFEPVLGVRDAAPSRGDDDAPRYDHLGPSYLRDELDERLFEAPVRFTLRMTLADPWDNPNDPTVVWPSNRRQVIMGTLDIGAGLHDWKRDDGDADERLAFNPGRLPLEYIYPTDDKLLEARILVYRLSQVRRDTKCPFEPAVWDDEMADLLELNIG